MTKGGAVIAAVALGTGAAGVTGAVDLPFQGAPDRGPAPAVESVPAPAEAAGTWRDGAPPSTATGTSGARGDAERTTGAGQADGRANGGPDRGHAGATEGSPGTGAPARGSDGVTGPPEHAASAGPPEQAVGTGTPDSAGTGTGNAGGSSAAAHERSHEPPSLSAAAHSNAGTGGPPAHANGQGNKHE